MADQKQIHHSLSKWSAKNGANVNELPKSSQNREVEPIWVKNQQLAHHKYFNETNHADTLENSTLNSLGSRLATDVGQHHVWMWPIYDHFESDAPTRKASPPLDSRIIF